MSEETWKEFMMFQRIEQARCWCLNLSISCAVDSTQSDVHELQHLISVMTWGM